MSKLTISEIISEPVREKLRAALGEHPEEIACSFDPEHPKRLLDVEYLNTWGKVRYHPCVICSSIKAEAGRWFKRGMPLRVIDATWDNFEVTSPEMAVARDDVQAWAKSSSWIMWLGGNAGTGKGHLTACAMKEIGGGKWITRAEINELVQSHYRGERKDPIPKLKKVQGMLVLDEMGAASKRKDDADNLGAILHHRFENKLKTAVLANVGRKVILEQLGLPGVSDRGNSEDLAIPFTWQSRRTQNEN